MKRYSAYLFLLLTLFLSAVQAAEWEVMTPRLNKNFRAVWGSASNDVFAVGGTGLIFHYDGSQWSEMDSGVLSYLSGIWGTSSTNVFAVGDGGTILHYDGHQWTAMSNRDDPYVFEGKNIENIWGNSSTDVFAVVNEIVYEYEKVGQIFHYYVGQIFHYDDDRWILRKTIQSYLHRIWGSSSTDVFAVGNSGTILHYDGHQWTAMNSGITSSLRGIWGTSSTDVFAVGDEGTILHYDGHQWTAMNSGTKSDLHYINGNSSTDVVAVSREGTILHYDGHHWATTINNSKIIFQPDDIWGNSSTNIFAIGSEGTIHHYDGNQWITMMPENLLGYENLKNIWGTSSTNMFLTSDHGNVFHYNDHQWTIMNSGTQVSDIWGSSDTDIFAVGSNGTILHYDGHQWTAMNSRTSQGLSSIWGSSSTDVFAVGSNGTTLHYDGNQWSTIKIGTSENLNGIWGSSSTDVFVVGNKNTIRHYDGNQWSTMKYTGLYPDDRELSGIWGNSSTNVFAWLNGRGLIFHYDGHQWTYNRSLLWLRDIWGRSSTDVFAVGYENGQYYDGKQWNGLVIKLRNGDSRWWGSGGRAIWCSPEGDIFIVRGSYILRCTDCQLEPATPQITPPQTAPNLQPHNTDYPSTTANLQITPTSHPFQNLALGQQTSQTFTITNVSNNAIQLPSLTLTNMTDFTLNNDTCSNTLLTPAGTCQVNINFQPQSEGQKLTKLNLPSNTTPVEASLDGSGCLNTLEQSFQFSPESPHFGTIEVNQSITLNPKVIFTATQGCGEVLQIETIQLAGRDAAEFSLQNIQCSHSHADKQSSSTCQFNLIFKPTSPGDKQADLTFKLLNHEELPTSTIPLSAQAITAKPAQLAVETDTTPSQPDVIIPATSTVNPATEIHIDTASYQPISVNSTVKPEPETEVHVAVEKDTEQYQATGTVKDQLGNPIAEVTIKIGDQTTLSDATGAWQIENLFVGNYTVTANKVGYTIAPQTVEVKSGEIVSSLTALTGVTCDVATYTKALETCHLQHIVCTYVDNHSETQCDTQKMTCDTAAMYGCYPLVITKIGAGTGTVQMSNGVSDPFNCDPICQGQFGLEEPVTLTAVADSGSVFQSWSGDCRGELTKTQVTIGALGTNCTAQFEPASRETQFALKVTKVGNGTVTSTPAEINCDPNCSGNYLAGTVVNLVATPDADSIFTQWSGACSGNSPTVTVTLDADKTCTATFAPIKPYLSTTINCTPNPVASLQKLHCILTAELSHAAPTTTAKNVRLMTTLPEGLVLTAINTEVGQCDISQLPQVTCQLNDLNRDANPTKVTLDLSLQDPNLLAMTPTAEISASNYPAAWARTRTFIAIPPEIQIDLALVIDVNRSMQEKINGVKADLEKLITNMTTYQPSLTALIVFKDEVRIKTLTTDRKVLLEAIQSLQTEENNTCPTASAEAVEIAARHLQPGGQIFLGTDAPPYPDADVESILTLLKAKNIHLNTLTMMGDCSMAKSWNQPD